MNAAVDRLTDQEVLALYYDWEGTWARPSQRIPSGEWLACLFQAGRGFGKTRVGAEWIRDGAENGCRRMALVGATASDVRDTMVEGESGILAISPPGFRPRYEPSKRRLVWPNGAMATCFSADQPERLRGPQHDRAWCDELAAWRRVREAYDMLLFGLRLGKDPRVVITTTPKPIAILREMRNDPTVVIKTGSTHENLHNLAPAFRQRILSKYEGTTIGQQELYALLLDEMPGALWKRVKDIESNRVQQAPHLAKCAIALDIATTSNEDSDETGMVWGGLGEDGHGYVCGDLTMKDTPDAWARVAIACYHENKADAIVYEANQGGDLIRSVLQTVDPNVPLVPVWASRGKRTRAEPIAALAEQGRIHHVGIHAQLEDELCNWVPGVGDSPNRLDAMVWLMTYLAPQSGLVGVLDFKDGARKVERPW